MALAARFNASHLARLRCLPNEEMARGVLPVQGLHEPTDLVALPDVTPLKLWKEDVAGTNVSEQFLDGRHAPLSTSARAAPPRRGAPSGGHGLGISSRR